jgi:SAM-dependent methyltransferase
MKAEYQSSDYFQSWDDAVFGGEQKIYRVIELVSRGVVRGDVLDLGCGSRLYYDVTSAKRWVGLDLSQKLLDDLRFVGGVEPKCPVETHCMSCWDLTFPDASFDTVTAIFLLHHLASKNRKHTKRSVLEALRQARRVLRDDGTLFVLATWPQPLLHLYHLAYPLLCPLARRLWKTELPCFLRPAVLGELARQAGFRECYPMAVDLYEDVRQPVLGFVLPAWAQRFIRKYTIYILKP